MSCAVASVEFSSSKTETILLPDVPESESSDSKLASQVNDENADDIRELLEAVPELDRVFNVMNKVGSGTFSSVYVASLKAAGGSSELYALKHLIPTSHPSRIENEIRCLKELRGQCNVVPVKACIRNCDHVVIIMPYIEHDRFQEYVQNMTPGEVQAYMFALLTAVSHVHEINLIHRDIKHSNFLYNRRKRQYALVDFGLAQKVPTAPHVNNPQSCQTDQSSSVPAPPENELKAQESKQQIHSPRKKLAHLDENFKAESDYDGAATVKSPRSGSRKSAHVLATLDAGQQETNNNSSSASRSLLRTLSANTLISAPGVDSKTTTVVSKQLKSSLAVAAGKQKSPRRTLLTKRVLDVQRQTCSTLTTVAAGPRQALAKRSGYGASSSGSLPKPVCRCFGQPTVCNVCLARSAERAPRAGTPGYRAPEVLMKYPHQTTAVDIWSVGVIFLSLLSGHYPIFKASDDLEALSQIIGIFGFEEVKAAAKKYGKQIDGSLTSTAVDLKVLCQRLRQSHMRMQQQQQQSVVGYAWSSVPDSAYELLKRLLDVDPFTRITASEALEHPFFAMPL